MRSFARRDVIALVAVVAGGISATALHSQQPKPTFKARTDLVQLSVSVLDKDRRPVRGLTAADFVVRENGTPQTVDVFSEVDLPDPEPNGAAWMSRAPADVETNAGDSERLIAIVLDDAMIPQDPLFVRQTKLIAREVINRLGPHDAACVVFTRDNRTARSFTSDHAKLFAAVDAFNGGTAFSGQDDYPLWVASEITISDVADALIALPNRSKTLVLVSVGIGFMPQLAAPTTRMRSAVGVREKQIRLQDLLQDTLNRARRANVSIYTFDPGGLDGLEGFCRAGPSRCGAPGGIGGFHDYMTLLAANTGGRPTLFTNDPIPGINAMFAENKSFYLLGYRQTTVPKPGEYRRLDVKVNRKGVEVRSSNLAYREATPEERAIKLRKPPPAANAKALANAMPDASIPLRLNLIPFARPDGPGATVIVTLGVSEPAPAGASGPSVESVDMLVRAFTFDGAPRGERAVTAQIRIAAPASAPSEPTPLVPYEVTSRLDIAKPGPYTIRVGIENNARAVAGSVFADLDVPDFTSALSLSGVAVGSSSAPSHAEIDSLRSVLPFMPTAQRTFASTDRVTAMVRIYENGGRSFPVTVRTMIRNKSDMAVYDRSESIPVDRFATDARADFLFSVPLAGLQAGPYLLSFEAAGGDKVVRREVVFMIR